MTYLERSTEIQEKITTHAVGLTECALELSELICDMANNIESLADDLRKYEEEDWNKRAYERA